MVSSVLPTLFATRDPLSITLQLTFEILNFHRLMIAVRVRYGYWGGKYCKYYFRNVWYVLYVCLVLSQQW